jgi:hypothetical protein
MPRGKSHTPNQYFENFKSTNLARDDCALSDFTLKEIEKTFKACDPTGAFQSLSFK